MFHKGADHTAIAMHDQLARKPLSSSVIRVTITVDEDQLERLLPIAGTFDHLLEHGSAVVTARSAALDELRGHHIAVSTAPGFQLSALVRNRKVVFSLAAGRDPHVECGAWCASSIWRGGMWSLIATSHVEHLAT
jgi:hypothetical protein